MTPIVLQYAEEAAANYAVTAADIFSRARLRKVVAARWELWRRLRELGWSLPRIGRETGFDHASVHYGISEANRQRKRLRAALGPTERYHARLAVQAAAQAMLQKHQRELASRY